jgi:hypothetical protein
MPAARASRRPNTDSRLQPRAGHQPAARTECRLGVKGSSPSFPRRRASSPATHPRPMAGGPPAFPRGQARWPGRRSTGRPPPPDLTNPPGGVRGVIVNSQ